MGVLLALSFCSVGSAGSNVIVSCVVNPGPTPPHPTRRDAAAVTHSTRRRRGVDANHRFLTPAHHGRGRAHPPGTLLGITSPPRYVLQSRSLIVTCSNIKYCEGRAESASLQLQHILVSRLVFSVSYANFVVFVLIPESLFLRAGAFSSRKGRNIPLFCVFVVLLWSAMQRRLALTYPSRRDEVCVDSQPWRQRRTRTRL